MRFDPTRLRDARLAADLTQERLARLSNTSVDAVRRAEQGRTTPAAETVARLARALGISMEELFDSEPAAA